MRSSFLYIALCYLIKYVFLKLGGFSTSDQNRTPTLNLHRILEHWGTCRTGSLGRMCFKYVVGHQHKKGVCIISIEMFPFHHYTSGKAFLFNSCFLIINTIFNYFNPDREGFLASSRCLSPIQSFYLHSQKPRAAKTHQHTTASSRTYLKQHTKISYESWHKCSTVWVSVGAWC